MNVKGFAERLLLIVGCILLLGVPLTGQNILDPFASGFDPALNWQGDTDAFVGNGGRLQLDDMRQTPTNEASVWIAANTRDNACWTLDAELLFSPSASNKAVWWLAADRPLDQSGIQGYFLQLGGISGGDDAYELFEATGSSNDLILSGQVGGAALDPVIGNLTVCRTVLGEWDLEVKDATGAVIDQGVGTNTSNLEGSFVGLSLDFTATRNGLFFFDNFGVDPVFIDQEAPTLLGAVVVDEQTVILQASEPLGATAASPSLYLIGGVAPTSASISGDRVELLLGSALASGQATTITVSAWNDLAGNEATNLSTTVTYTAPRQLAPFELLISEIMADPTPVVGLPEFEYLELYNAGRSPIDLSTVSISDDGSLDDLPAIMLAAGSYVALTEDAGGDSRFVSFPDFPNLSNSGGLLALLADGELIDQVEYTPGWHDSSKDDGGYSLERRDLNQPCLLGQENWGSSVSLSGGTPGMANSISGGVESDSLKIIGAEVQTFSLILVRTNRALSDFTGAFELTNGGGLTVLPTDRLNEYQIELVEPLMQGVPLGVRLRANSTSCLGSDVVSLLGVTIGIPDLSEIGDWELNEIMFDPLTGQGRWIELVNVSNKLLSTEGLLLAQATMSDEVDELFEPFGSLLVPAGGYVVFADDVESLLREFPNARIPSILPTDVPTIGNEDCIMLFDPVNQLIYFNVCYTDDWHNQAYANTDGVSLERIDLGRLPQSADNWTSAAATVNFATPTLPNSQARMGETLPQGTFALASDRISPDGDGFEDLLRVDYTFAEPGVLARFEIVDLLGRPVLKVNQDTSPGISGTWTWDGVDTDGDVVDVGTYVLRVTYFSPQTPREVENIAFSVLAQR